MGKGFYKGRRYWKEKEREDAMSKHDKHSKPTFTGVVSTVIDSLASGLGIDSGGYPAEKAERPRTSFKAWERQVKEASGELLPADFKPGTALKRYTLPEDGKATAPAHTTYTCHGHDGSALVYAAHGAELYGASGSDLNPDGAALVIDCGGVFSDRHNRRTISKFVSGPKRWSALNKYGNAPLEVVRFHWSDMRSPGMPLEFWHEVWKLLPVGKTIICCIGGHGRTGTALAALMIADGVGYEEAVKTVRTRHCSRAVETMEQKEYLEELAELAAAERAKNGEPPHVAYRKRKGGK